MKNYLTEREGQIDFFNNFRIDYLNNKVLVDNTDGVWNGNLMEFKLTITDLNKVLFQAIKYLSYMRIKGESIPKNILLVSLNTETAYLYHSQDYFNDIHEVYTGGASKNNAGFAAQSYLEKFDYHKQEDALSVLNVLMETGYMPVDLDENCIVGWAERYYRENPTASKGDFLGDDSGQVKVLGEIRSPKHFKGLINPYIKPTNEKFKYLMDKLNDRLKKKDLGAFYSPLPYCKKATELVRMAIDRVPAGNDYIILDRCAGTGNLESVLSDEELSHCILSTYEYYEYKVLVERLGGKVRAIIPPTEANVEYANGCVMNADAMSEDYINNPILQAYIQNPKVTIILYENPPYRDVTSSANGTSSGKSQSFVLSEMKKEVKGPVTNDLANLFIWSGFNFFLRQKTDSYIVFSPIKYWKTCELCNKVFRKGYLFNREHFHATPSGIACCMWENVESDSEQILLEAYDIIENKAAIVKTIPIRKAHSLFTSKYYVKSGCNDDIEDGICCNLDGTERTTSKTLRIKKIYNPNIICYIRASSFNFDPLSKNILRCGEYDGNGFFVRTDFYLNKLPLWVAKNIPLNNWYEKDIYATTSDGGDAYTKDKEFLKRCLIYTCLSNQNKCLSFHGSDGRDYQNELCFDTGSLASADLAKMQLDADEQELMTVWNKILGEAKQTVGYDARWNYGVYQITKELNTYTEIGFGKNKQRVYDYPELNGDLTTLKTKLKEYYKSHITELMFKYELLK